MVATYLYLIIVVRDFQAFELEACSFSFVEYGFVVDVLDARSHVLCSAYHWEACVFIFCCQEPQTVKERRRYGSHGCVISRA